MPILGFEQHRYRKKLTAAMYNTPPSKQSTGDETSLLIRAYFRQDPLKLHCRRTLDQFTYHMLHNTEKRDNSQVIWRWARTVHRRLAKEGRDPPPNHPSDPDGYPLLMIDQLWLWVLEDDDTVITCFPNTWDSNPVYNLSEYLLKRVLTKNDNRPLIESAMDLANLIIKCGVDFITRKGPQDISLQESFQSSINDIVSVC